MNRKETLFAVLRHDRFQKTSDPEKCVSIVCTLPDVGEAKLEVERLNNLHSDGQVHYWYVHCRYYPEGRGVRPNETTVPRSKVS